MKKILMAIMLFSSALYLGPVKADDSMFTGTRYTSMNFYPRCIDKPGCTAYWEITHTPKGQLRVYEVSMDKSRQLIYSNKYSGNGKLWNKSFGVFVIIEGKYAAVLDEDTRSGFKEECFNNPYNEYERTTCVSEIFPD